MYKIDVDAEVMAVLKKQADPFVDTPNDVLRRLLLNNTQEPVQMPVIPAGVPKALAQTLEVISLMHSGVPRVEATQRVAKSRGVTRNSVLDKYCRQLAGSTEAFDNLLKNPNNLVDRLMIKFPGHRDLIKSIVLGSS
jgi:hypothetical protein